MLRYCPRLTFCSFFTVQFQHFFLPSILRYFFYRLLFRHIFSLSIFRHFFTVNVHAIYFPLIFMHFFNIHFQTLILQSPSTYHFNVHFHEYFYRPFSRIIFNVHFHAFLFPSIIFTHFSQVYFTLFFQVHLCSLFSNLVYVLFFRFSVGNGQTCFAVWVCRYCLAWRSKIESHVHLRRPIFSLIKVSECQHSSFIKLCNNDKSTVWSSNHWYALICCYNFLNKTRKFMYTYNPNIFFYRLGV